MNPRHHTAMALLLVTTIPEQQSSSGSSFLLLLSSSHNFAHHRKVYSNCLLRKLVLGQGWWKVASLLKGCRPCMRAESLHVGKKLFPLSEGCRVHSRTLAVENWSLNLVFRSLGWHQGKEHASSNLWYPYLSYGLLLTKLSDGTGKWDFWGVWPSGTVRVRDTLRKGLGMALHWVLQEGVLTEVSAQSCSLSVP